jgi:hypothetical protein
MPAPFRVDLDQRRGHRNDAHAGRHRGSDAHVEVDVGGARNVAAGQDGFSDRRSLLRGQSLRALLSLALCSLPVLLTLRRLRLGRALLIALSLAGALGLSLVVLLGSARGGLIALLRLTRGVLLHRLLLPLLRLDAALARAALRRLALLSRSATLTLRARGCAGLPAALRVLG